LTLGVESRRSNMKTVARKFGYVLALLVLGEAACLEAQDFHFALMSDNVEQVRTLLKANPNLVNTNSISGQPPLVEAAQCARIGMVELFLTNGAAVNARGVMGRSALHWAVERGDVKVAELLFKHKADANVRDDNGFTPIIEAIGSAKMIKLLLAHGADINAHGERNTALSQAVAHPESTGAGVVELLLTNGADIMVSGDLVIDHAVTFGSTNDVALLVPYYKNSTNSEAKLLLLGALEAAMQTSRRPMAVTIATGLTRLLTNALHQAVTRSDAAAVRGLVAARPEEVNAREYLGWTSLHMAACSGNAAVAEILLSTRADPDSRDEMGNTPLHWAAFLGHSNAVEVLLRYKANMDVIGSIDNTPLDYAIREGFTSIAAMLITNGAGLKPHNRWGHTPLHLAASRENDVVVRLLLSRGADANAVGGPNYRQTPLDLAVTGNSAETVRLLLAAGASLQSKTAGEGGTLFHLWAGKGNTSVADQLLAAGCDVNAADHDGKTPLHNTASPTAAVRWMLEHKADVNAQDNDGKTPLHYWVTRGNGDVTRLLLDYKAGVNAIDKSGKTPLRLLREFTKQNSNPRRFTPDFSDVVRLMQTYGARE
jgi:ankyrin repeat protein